ncbi:MAG: hypothetical protein LUE27_08360 [Clostridia bacterium]|nr:hypothetical protein [Clostridia bacterium]
MRYYRGSIPIPKVEGISLQKRKDGTFVMYRYTEHVTEPEEKDVVRTCTIGKKPWELFDEMYPNENYPRLFPDDRKFDDSMLFPDEFEVNPGIFVFLKRVAENCGLADLLRASFENCWKEIMDLAIYLVQYPHTGYNLDEYLDKSLLMNESSRTARHITDKVRGEVRTKDIRRFVSAWAGSNRYNGGVWIYTDASFWKRVTGGFFGVSGFDYSLNPDVEGPEGYLPVLNFALGMRGSDGMPLFYTDTGFDAGVNIYEAAADLAKKHHAKRFSFMIRDAEYCGEAVEKLESLGCDYVFKVMDNPSLCEKCKRTAEEEGLFSKNTGVPNFLDRNLNKLYATVKAECGSRDGWMYVYRNLAEEQFVRRSVRHDVLTQQEDAKTCLGKALDEMEHNPEYMNYITFNWASKDGKQIAESFAVDEEAVRFDDFMAGTECFFSTAESGSRRYSERLDDAREYSRIVESKSLNLRDSLFGYSYEPDDRPDDCWKTGCNETESFIKFVACILTYGIHAAIDKSGLVEADAAAITADSALASLQSMSATRRGRGRFRLDDPLDSLQIELFNAAGMEEEDIMNELEEAGQRYVSRHSA